MNQTAPARLFVPLLPSQVEAAGRLHGRLRQWQAADQALGLLRERFPDFDPSSVLLKTVVLNGLYGTNVYALHRMADHIVEVLNDANLGMAGPELVDRIAKLPRGTGERVSKGFVTFASKFAHFFIDAQRFPICDSYAPATVNYHLKWGSRTTEDVDSYEEYARDFFAVRDLAGLNCSTREMDHYLWLAGLYHHWLKTGDEKINVEARELFQEPGECAPDLRALLRLDA